MYEEFAAFLSTQLRDRKESVHRLSAATGIPEDVLEQLVSGDASRLPAAPYLHGYVVKLGEALRFDGEAWWQQLKRAAHTPSSGVSDRLPRNRFSRNRVPAWALWGIPAFLIALTFLGFRFADIVGLPDVAITSPDRDGVVMTASPTLLSGTAAPGSRVTVNGEAIPLTDAGAWEKEVLLQPGAPNDFTVQATKFLGRRRSVSRRIFLELPMMATSSTSTSPAGPAASSASSTPAVTPSSTGTTSVPTTFVEF